METHRLLRGFLSESEVERHRRLVRESASLSFESSGRFGLGPRCRMLRGQAARHHLGGLVELGNDGIRQAAERFSGRPLLASRDFARAFRVQTFDGPQHSFRWHYDVSAYAAILALADTGGETQIVSAGMSRAIRPAFYALYWLPALFAALPRVSVRLEPGDLLLMQGARVLHRGMPGTGERVVAIYGYDDAARPPSRVRERLARFLNEDYRAATPGFSATAATRYPK